MEFKISSRAKRVAFILMGMGLIGLLIGFFTEQSYITTSVNEDGSMVTFEYYDHNNGHNTQEDWDQFKLDLVAAAKAMHVEILDGGGHGHSDVDDHDHEHEGGQPLHADEDTHNNAHGGGHAEHGGHGHGPKQSWTVGAHIINTEAGLAAWHHNEDAVLSSVKELVDSHSVGLPDHQHSRFWSNLLINGFFFFGISLGALFYLALHYATESGWAAVVLRVFEGVMLVIPFGSIVLLVVFIGASMEWNHIYMWMDETTTEFGNANFDKLLYRKSGYLNDTFFWIRTIVYIAVFWLFALFFRKLSKKEDKEGGIRLHFLQYRRGALFLIFFAVFSSTLAWDWLMSIDAHWFSTLYGWYVFSGIWISAMIMILMTTLYLKSRGHLPQINQSHVHDLAKWIFAISFLWSYLWFSQFMLIWYSNIGEEVTYFQQRIMDYKFLFFGTFAVNFILPMVLMMSRDAKRAWSLIMIVSGIIFVGHWLDVYMMVMPGTVMNNYQIGYLEIGMFVMFLGVFILLLLKNLTKAPLIKKNHPMLEESIHHDF
jgi:hypothetical protein